MIVKSFVAVIAVIAVLRGIASTLPRKPPAWLVLSACAAAEGGGPD